MKTFLIILLALLAAIGSSFAQKLIAVQNGGEPTFYQQMDSAIIHAQSGDTIYIPGGAFSFPDYQINIDKELHLVGTGHNPDSTKATGITLLNAHITLVEGANNSSFEGFNLNGEFRAGSSSTNEDVDYIKISRCNFDNIYLSRLSTHWMVTENVIRGNIQGYNISTGSAQSNLFLNNIITGYCRNFGINNEFMNNIFFYKTSIGHPLEYYLMSSINGCVFRNNIFFSTTTVFPGYDNWIGFSALSSTFENNLWYGAFSVPDGSIGSNNISRQTSDNTFVNQSGNVFNYAHDYHLKPESPGKNAGKDGTDIGIYGGVSPWKEGIPFNPHYQRINISRTTDNNGILNVNIKVEAQER